MKVVIIGGVAGGASAAARLRRLDERAEIVVLERTGYMSYANCGLPERAAARTHPQMTIRFRDGEMRVMQPDKEGAYGSEKEADV